MANEEIITALDIGTGKIFGISCLVRDTGIEVLATNIMNFSENEDIVRKGRIADIEEVSTCIFDVLKALENESGEWPALVNIGLGGGHVKGILFPRSIDIEPKGREINNTDVQLLKKEIKTAISAAHGQGRQVLCSIPQDYIIDNVNLVKNPSGMHGNLLEIKVHVITADINPVQDIRNCIKKAGSQLESIYPHSWAAAASTLSDEEKKLGCLLVDIGKGTTDIAFFSDNSILLTDSIKLGGENIDRDISKVLHTPVSYAGELKEKHAFANYPHLMKEKNPVLDEAVEIFDLSGKLSTKVTRGKISHIVHARTMEILEDFVRRKVEKTFLLHSCGAGIIISGGGARLKGINHLASEVFGLPARTGIPRGLLNLDKSFQSPEFASALGTVILASKQDRKKGKTGFLQKFKGIASIPQKWF